MVAGKSDGGAAAADEARAVHRACSNPGGPGSHHLLQPPGHTSDWQRGGLPHGILQSRTPQQYVKYRFPSRTLCRVLVNTSLCHSRTFPVSLRYSAAFKLFLRPLAEFEVWFACALHCVACSDALSQFEMDCCFQLSLAVAEGLACALRRAAGTGGST